MEVNVNVKYMDGVFRMLFKDKSKALALYNAMNDTSYDNVDDLIITTLDNAIYIGMKNDMSFMIASILSLYEQQSTFNPNMPLRNLFYVSDILQSIVKDENLYGSALVKIPTPNFVVFYNGSRKMPERMELKLSEAFEVSSEKPELELTTTMININRGNNNSLLEKCSDLREYMIYVDTVRRYSETLSLNEAVAKAVDECIKNNILGEFLLSQKAEVIKVSIYEYDREKHMKFIRQEGYDEGREEGREEEREAGIEILVRNNEKYNIPMKEIINNLQTEYGLTEEKAQEYYTKYRIK